MAVPSDDVTYAVLAGSVDLLAAKERAEAAAASAAERARARTTVLAQISHDLRSPLNSMLGFTELIHVELGAEAERIGEYLAAIRRNGQTLLALIEDVMDVAAMESGRLSIHPHSTTLAALLADVWSIIGPRVRAGAFIIEWPAATAIGHCPLVVDRRRLVQAVVNVIDNACAVTPRNGRVTVEVHVQPGCLRITIADGGPGLALADQERVFQPFVRIDTSHRGSGLGLAIVRGIAEGHGGHVELISQLGQGSQFTLAIPTEVP